MKKFKTIKLYEYNLNGINITCKYGSKEIYTYVKDVYINETRNDVKMCLTLISNFNVNMNRRILLNKDDYSIKIICNSVESKEYILNNKTFKRALDEYHFEVYDTDELSFSIKSTKI